MSIPIGLDNLENVFDAYVAADDELGGSLEEWIQNYPEYEQEITGFAISWTLMNSLPPAPIVEGVEEDTLVLRGMSIVQNLLHDKLPQAGSEIHPQFDSLLSEGRARGLSPGKLASQIGMGAGLLRKLDRRLIRRNSIPRKAIEAIAEAIQHSTSNVDAYLQQGPVLIASTEHRAEQTPTLSEPEDFFDAVRSDPTMSQEHAERWLALTKLEDTPCADGMT